MNVVAVSYIASGVGNDRVKQKSDYCKDDNADIGNIQDHAVNYFLYFAFDFSFLIFWFFKVNYTLCFQVMRNQFGVFLKQVHSYTADPVVTHSIFTVNFCISV